VVPTEHEWYCPSARLLDDLRSDAHAGLLDLGQEPRTLVVECRRLGNGRLDVPVISNVVAQALEPLLEPRVADRGRAHVDSAAALSEVQRCADDRDLALGSRSHHRNANAKCGCADPVVRILVEAPVHWSAAAR